MTMIMTMKHLKYFNENKKMESYPSILFSDIVKSSELWTNDPVGMDKKIQEHFNLVDEISKKYNGFIVKSIGDAFMIYFNPDNSLMNAIKAGIEIIEGEEMNLRIGICNGKMMERTQNIQGVELKDYFGNVVNSASRLESKVSESGEISFGYSEDISEKESKDIKSLIDKYDYEKIEFSHKCTEEEKSEMRGKRSARLLSDIQINSCEDVSVLKGVDELITFKIKVKK